MVHFATFHICPFKVFTDYYILQCVLLAVSIISYASLPFWLEREARIRKEKTGHATPLQAMEDAEHSQISDAARARLHEINAAEESAALKYEMEKQGGTELEQVEDLEAGKNVNIK
jgi:hypothetical protein